ncbi:acyltransferase family protein [Paenibacillus eucommiae]|uniref:Peptidoglycan/LPS O-acetylase OafA/YrhL n=1 Tax=Paenibacillus eucommiae TaxID=1355755 RepID=A0ABS4IS01_9BACL|nr:acyltransferase [Paenibacillus eucommiae]MBP1990357.1 peptidoglycan/LPS O-acetylase OafA/YrhL [Paenibacillus eucommiae]
MNRRFEELDSLRGIAAMTVLLAHLFVITPSLYLINKFMNTPLHMFWGGHEAVILFFILSGFVLSLPYYNQNALNYKDYLIRRVCRIYIPYISCIILSVILLSFFSRVSIYEMTNVFEGTWENSVSSKLLISHFLFLGDFNSLSYNPVVWSLVHEMRISIVFPFVMYFVVKLSWKKNIFFALSCTVIFFLLWYLSLNILNYNPTYLISIHYIGLFILGALLAKHRQYISDLYDRLSVIIKLFILLIGILAYTYTWWFLPNHGRLHLTIINDWFIAIGGSIFIIYSIKSTIFKKILLLKPIHFIGKTSYSLYLFHMPLILTLLNVFYGKIPTGYIIIIAFISSFILAGVTYYLIEKPSIKLGKYITNKMKLNSSKLKSNKIKIEGNQA